VVFRISHELMRGSGMEARAIIIFRPAAIRSGTVGLVLLGLVAALISPGESIAQVRLRLPEIRFSVATSYDSNPFHLRDSWRRDFSQLQANPNRLAGFNSVSDVVTRFSLRFEKSWRRDKGTRFGARLQASYDAYGQNAFANFAELQAGGSLSFRQAGESALRISWIPNRQRANYRLSYSAADEFLPAPYNELEVSYSHEIELDKRLDAGLNLIYGRRLYGRDFSNRDRRELRAGIELAARIKRKTQLSVEAAIGGSRTSDRLEYGIPTDRSRNSTAVRTELSSWIFGGEGAVAVAYRERWYTTDVNEDASRYRRRDQRWKFSAEWGVRVSEVMRLQITLDAVDNTSNRNAQLTDPDIVPYSGYSFGLEMRFDLH